MARTQVFQEESDELQVKVLRFLPLLAHGTVAAGLLALHPSTLSGLGGSVHKLFKPVRRVVGAKRPVYTNIQMLAIKKAMLGHMEPDEAYRAFLDAEWEEAHQLARVMDRMEQIKSGKK